VDETDPDPEGGPTGCVAAWTAIVETPELPPRDIVRLSVFDARAGQFDVLTIEAKRRAELSLRGLAVRAVELRASTSGSAHTLWVAEGTRRLLSIDNMFGDVKGSCRVRIEGLETPGAD
jgi:hypothetical protein